ERIVSDRSWKARVHPAYYTTGEPNPNWRLPESNVAFDAQKDLPGWTTSDYDDDAWPQAIEYGTPPAKPWGKLVERSVPQWRDNGLVDYENSGEWPEVSSGEPIVMRLPYNAQITPYLSIETRAGEVIDIRTDNYEGGGETNVRAEYVTRGGVQDYESLGWMNGHEVIYRIPEGVRTRSLKYRESGYDTDLAGEFRCSDERLTTLWKKAQRTLYLELRDGFVDCPGRERAQWWGDITLELQQAFYALDRRSDRLARKAIRELAAWQMPNGVLFSPIPAGDWDQELPMQMLASVGRFGFWEYYRHTGDATTIEGVYPAVNRYLALWELGDDGLVVPREGGWTWGDWGDNKDLPLLYNAWYYLALDGRHRMAELLRDEKQAARDNEAMQSLASAFRRKFWTDRGYRSPEHKGPTDDRGNALAVVSGIATNDQRDTLLRVLTTQRHASPYMEKYVLEGLFLLGEPNAAMDRMLDRYGPMIDSPITTLWEGWGVGPAGYGGGSYNHAWAGGVLTLLSQYVAGIDPAEPGYSVVEVKANPGRLAWVEATVQSPRGVINVTVETDGDDQQVTVTAPDTVTIRQ
ncbi:MAG: alpha-L-rhamnosidase C-terminal domain-containing protein, partial [Planctomycetota bacterium]